MDQTEEALGILCGFAADFKYEDIKDEDRTYLKYLFTDYFSAAMAGYRVNADFNESMRRVLFDMGGTEQSSVIFSDKKLPAADAALLNGCYAGGAEMDDGHRRANGHPGSSIISSVLAMAETLDVSERDVLTAIAVGYEIFCRLSSSVQPGQGSRGFHPTGMTGALASAAACAKLLNPDRRAFESAFAAAVLQCSGILTAEEFKPLSPGKAAFNGVLTAKLVQNGADAGDGALKKCTRWFRAVSDVFDMDKITSGLGDRLSLSECYIKLYPACRHLHGAIDAAIKLRDEVDPFKADRIIVSLYKSAYNKATAIVHPTNAAEAKFSTAYVTASAFLNGGFGLDDLDVDRADPRISGLADKFEFVEKDELEDRKKGIRGSEIEIIEDGKSYFCHLDLPRGEPEFPVTPDDLKQKMKMCAGDLLNSDSLENLWNRLDRFGTEDKFEPVRILPAANGRGWPKK